MALIQKKLSKEKQIKLGVALLSIIGLTFGVAYFGIFKKPSQPEQYGAFEPVMGIFDSSSKIPQKSGFEKTKELVEDPFFKKLRSFGIWPLKLEPKGKSQPFVAPDKEQQNDN